METLVAPPEHQTAVVAQQAPTPVTAEHPEAINALAREQRADLEEQIRVAAIRAENPLAHHLTPEEDAEELDRLRSEAFEALGLDTEPKLYLAVAESLVDQMDPRDAAISQLELVSAYSRISEPDKAQAIIDRMDPESIYFATKVIAAGNTDGKSVSTRQLALQIVADTAEVGPTADAARRQLEQEGAPADGTLEYAVEARKIHDAARMKDGKRYTHSQPGFIPDKLIERYRADPQHSGELIAEDVANVGSQPYWMQENVVMAVTEFAVKRQAKLLGEM